ncbi:urea ABC transporter substrate-binding protein [Thiosulfativibrio zosterae]|uniref:Urea ABC transporter substrate-binding protein n=1 Tax=Thiosulfativibrio zosterae TaxID=2675053 RepID=A0A6F8PQY3_9GAMM|nr:urea ABC transporter substrate-binding protein [Thiosulfativibrio zosterae]BBP44400.1 urea ABC transporter substrate-binding protein [Thiosulfativibrio zosterae]
MNVQRPKWLVRANTALLLILGVVFLQLLWGATQPKPIQVGVLHSLTGPMALSEQGVIQATLMAIDEINQQGGVMGRPLQPILVDGASLDKTFAAGAERLVSQDKVPVIFGCWTSASRKAVKPVIEAHQNLLFYPVQYEGLEASERIVYSAEVPNQQIIPAISWVQQHLGQKILLIGSDYVFPHIANMQIQKVAETLGMTVLKSQYYGLNNIDFSDLDSLLALKPDAIINTLNGDGNRYFFETLSRLQPDNPVPVMSFSFSSVEAKSYLKQYGLSLEGHYVSWGYDPNLDTVENNTFIKAYRARYGQDEEVNSPMVNAYVNVYLWKLAAEKVESIDSDAILSVIHRVGFTGPAGKVFVDKNSRHTWKPDVISQLTASGESQVVWQSSSLIKPEPFSIFETSYEDSAKALTQLYEAWGGAWQAPE